MRNRQFRHVEIWPEVMSGSPAELSKFRFVWAAPLTISPHDHNKVYVGSQHVHVTTDGGASWQLASPDLTLNDRSKMGSSGGLTPDNIGVEYAGVVFTIAESRLKEGLIWAGTNDGPVQVTQDGGRSWANVTDNIAGLPPWSTISNIELSRFHAGTAYLTADLHQMNNRDPWVFKTTDYGRTWRKIVNGIAVTPMSYAHVVREDPVRRGLPRPRKRAAYPHQLIQKLLYLANGVATADFPPTTQARDVHRELTERLRTYRARFGQLVSQELPKLNTTLRQRNITSVVAGTPP